MRFFPKTVIVVIGICLLMMTHSSLVFEVLGQPNAINISDYDLEFTPHTLQNSSVAGDNNTSHSDVN